MKYEEIVKLYDSGRNIDFIAEIFKARKDDDDKLCREEHNKEKITKKNARRHVELVILHHVNKIIK